MTIYEMIRAQLAKTVPFASHVGVEIVEVANGEAMARLPQTPTSVNHIASQHAGALFTLGEAASGAAMAGAFASRLATIRPVAGSAQIKYTRVARGTVTAKSAIGQDVDSLTAKLDGDGKIAFDIRVTMTDEAGKEVANMTVAWHLKKLA